MKIDPLEIISNLQNLIPTYDPFFSAEERKIVGYEVIGKFVKNHIALDIDAFFMDQQVPEEYRLEAYHHLLKVAIDHYLQDYQTGFLAIRMDPEILLFDDKEYLLQLILEKGKLGINPSQIVFILPEENLKGIEDTIEHCVQYIKTFGIKISVENGESSGVRLERIAPLSPHFIRINLSSLKSLSQSIGMEETLHALSSFARKTGATLMFDKIEMEYQLRIAWKNGGRFLQGPYLSGASPIFDQHTERVEQLKNDLSRFITYEKKKLEALYRLEQTLNQDLLVVLDKGRVQSGWDVIIEEASKVLGQKAFRVYICDENGYQVSANLLRSGPSWIKQVEYIHKNWSWRPYFLENVFKMNMLKQGLLSDLYSDIETGELIRTFSIPVNSQYFMFIDLSYSYLYEEENLL